MKHRVEGKILGRDTDHRKSLLRNLATSLILNGSIKTTVAKAKFARPYVEKLVTKAKSKSFNTIKYLRTRLWDEDAVRDLVDVIGPKFNLRPGGYTRIIRLGRRLGDDAETARLEWVEKIEREKSKKTKEKPKEKGEKEEKKPRVKKAVKDSVGEVSKDE